MALVHQIGSTKTQKWLLDWQTQACNCWRDCARTLTHLLFNLSTSASTFLFFSGAAENWHIRRSLARSLTQNLFCFLPRAAVGFHNGSRQIQRSLLHFLR